MKLFIPVLPKLPNTLLGSSWYVRSTHARKWRRYIGEALMEFQPVKKLQFAYVTLTRCSPRSCDFDGLVGSFKPVLDALVKNFAIEDDDPVHVSVEYEWQKTARKEQGIKITVEG